jgi:ribosome maturation factor RimP
MGRSARQDTKTDSAAQMPDDAMPAAPTERFARETGRAAELASIIEPVLESMGFRLVRVHVTGGTAATLQIMAERPDGSMSIDDCETISKQLSPVLDVADALPGAYRLEVSSPGIDRPLVRPSDFEAWAGQLVKIELKELIDGRRRFRGTIEGYEDGEARVEIEMEGQEPAVIGLPIGLIEEAKLVLTDELIRESLRRAKKKGKGGLTDGSVAPDDLEEEK